ncbi:MAG: benzoyl-CoA reductase, bzd-type, subunit Q [Firmicutes bacterium]|nr:benzoyl-CoA reductase, bzd-type, subunit Q [Bacillota bacterium]
MATGKKKEHWRWEESNWHNPEIDWVKARIITAGVDVGSVSSQAVIMCDGKLFAYSNMRTGSNSPDSALNAINWAMEETGLTLDDLHYTVGTGYGRINVPFANRAVTEIACHARSGGFMYGPTVRTILDIGGQDSKVIHCDSKGKVTSFIMNDKCAAGTGRGMEVFADLLDIPIGEVGTRSLDVEEEPEPVSSTCVVFAKTEAVGLLHAGWSKERVLAAYCSSMAQRVLSLLNRIGIKKDLVITGGIAKNIGIVSRIEDKLGITALKPRYDTQIAGAVGAALFARALIEKDN